ncbi:hypothetical protein HanXRQr2_Chr16g0755401 [Helianthus annuus]|uniref:Uncharacterized protein n=1 Tax=Helianthus annuus TaxID=4232 RepID=A0A9K3GZ77_HELAN|nr:hypothetical protein HanXRQr2_Chr16g0755401 [Helianthus annuus]KAJ0821755.1 hypothetical protein HanPSC8_Chr16g0723931 [Helianthus annuus]
MKRSPKDKEFDHKERLTLCTGPNPPWPSLFLLAKPSVADSNDIRLNNVPSSGFPSTERSADPVVPAELSSVVGP